MVLSSSIPPRSSRVKHVGPAFIADIRGNPHVTYLFNCSSHSIIRPHFKHSHQWPVWLLFLSNRPPQCWQVGIVFISHAFISTNLLIPHHFAHLCLAWCGIVRLDNLNGIPCQLTDLLRRPPRSLAELHTGCPKGMKRTGTDTGLLAEGVESVKRKPAPG